MLPFNFTFIIKSMLPKVYEYLEKPNIVNIHWKEIIA